MINIFGIWLVAANISYLSDSHYLTDNCTIYFVGGSYVDIRNHKCTEVAKEINKTIIKRR